MKKFDKVSAWLKFSPESHFAVTKKATKLCPKFSTLLDFSKVCHV